MLKRWQQLNPTQKMHLQIWIIFSCILCFIVAVNWFARQNSVPPGVSISDWKIARLPLEQFYADFERGIEGLYNQSIVIHTPHASEPLKTSYRELGLKTNEDEILTRLDGLSSGNLLKRATSRWFMSNAKLNLALKLDPELVDRAAIDHWHILQNSQPQNAQRTVDANDNVRLNADIPAYRIDTGKLLQQLEQSLYTQFYAQIDKKLLESPEVFSMELPVYRFEAEMKLADLENQRVKRKIMSFSTQIAGNNEGKRHNIVSTATVLHDQLLVPGEVFDYSKVIEATRQKHGFREAPVILNGTLVPGIGGGICQVSTTLYNAVLRLGLEVVERRNHSLPITYAPLGQDATYSTGYINFRFRNSLDSHLLIRTEIKGAKITVKLFGDFDENTKYTIESKIVETVPAPVKVVHNPTLAKGTEKVINPGKQGYVVDTFRTKWINGQKGEPEKISRDHYIPEPRIVAKNQKGSNSGNSPKAPRKQIIEDGVSGPVL